MKRKKDKTLKERIRSLMRRIRSLKRFYQMAVLIISGLPVIVIEILFWALIFFTGVILYHIRSNFLEGLPLVFLLSIVDSIFLLALMRRQQK